MHLLQQVSPRYYSSTQREQELNHDPSFWSRSWVPTRLMNRKNGSFMLFPLNGSSMMWVWKEWNSMLRKLSCNERTAYSRCWADLLPLLHYMGFQLFNSDHLMGLTTHLHSSGLENETIARGLFILPETSFISCEKLKLRLNFKTSLKH